MWKNRDSDYYFTSAFLHLPSSPYTKLLQGMCPTSIAQKEKAEKLGVTH